MGKDILDQLMQMNEEKLSDPFLGCSEELLAPENWLTQDNCMVDYKCPECGRIYQVEASRRVPDNYLRKFNYVGCVCESDEIQVCKYAGIQPRKLNLATKTTFDKNGRKGVRTTFGDGHSFTRSQTKENVLNGKKPVSVLTKGCNEASEKAKKEIVHNRLNGMKRDIMRQEQAKKEQRRK